MIDRSKLGVRGLVERYLVANMPGYLFRHFRRDVTVRDLANTYSAEDLVSLVVELDQLSHKTVEDLATAYAALTALGFHNADEVKRVIPRLGGVRSFRWLDQILQNVLDRMSVSTIKIQMPSTAAVHISGMPES